MLVSAFPSFMFLNLPRTSLCHGPTLWHSLSWYLQRFELLRNCTKCSFVHLVAQVLCRDGTFISLKDVSNAADSPVLAWTMILTK